MSSSHISIIMSTYLEFANGQLQDAVSSVLRQTYRSFELIIVGDATPLASQIRAYLSHINDTRISFINLEEHSGTSSPGTVPKQVGTAMSKGELIAFLDADNMYTPTHLESCVAAFVDDPSLDLVYGNTLVTLPKNKRLASRSRFIWKKPRWNKKRAKLIARSNFLDMSEAVFTRRAYEESGGLSKAHMASDWLLWNAMIRSGHDHFLHLNHIGLVYRTSSYFHHLTYYIFMVFQNLGISYASRHTELYQKIIAKRLIRKHSPTTQQSKEPEIPL